MKEYILINRVPEAYSGTDAQKVKQKWDMVTGKWKKDGIFISSFVFPNVGFTISNNGDSVQNETITANGLKVVSTIILKAASYDNAIALAKACPILEQGGSVEIVEIFKRPS